MDKNKIEIRDLYLIFGSERSKAFRMLKKGKSKNEILKETGCTIAVNNASLSVREGEIFVIMGLSGSGKSSLLRCINRLNRPTSGEILINGEDIAGMPVERLRSLRRKELAMVFQHFGLLPHYTVLQNIAFGLELQGVEKREREPFKKCPASVAIRHTSAVSCFKSNIPISILKVPRRYSFSHEKPLKGIAIFIRVANFKHS